MSRIPTIIIGILVLVVLLLSMVTYRVRYFESVVVTTFGRAGEGAVKNATGDDAGLKFKWPWPIQEVARTYDSRILIVEDKLEELQTKDRQSIVMAAYISYRITDPLAFYRTLSTTDNAERQLRDRLRATKARIGEYTFDDITNADPSKLKLAELEEKMRNQMQAELDKLNFGVRLDNVGIKRLIFAEAVTGKVFDRMRSNRVTLAQVARSDGEQAGATIRSNAQSARDRILAFADQRAQLIRAEGEADAASLVTVFEQNPELSVFLRSTETLKTIFRNNTIFFIDKSWGAPFDLPGKMQSANSPLKPQAKRDE